MREYKKEATFAAIKTGTGKPFDKGLIKGFKELKSVYKKQDPDGSSFGPQAVQRFKDWMKEPYQNLTVHKISKKALNSKILPDHCPSPSSTNRITLKES